MKWSEPARYQGTGNWEIDAADPSGEYAVDVSLADDGSLSVMMSLPPGSGIGGALAMLGEALTRLNTAQYGVTTGTR